MRDRQRIIWEICVEHSSLQVYLWSTTLLLPRLLVACLVCHSSGEDLVLLQHAALHTLSLRDCNFVL